MDIQKEKRINTTPSVKTTEKIQEPPKYKVILLNDDFTPMDFVVAVIVEIFHKSQEEAVKLMYQVHKTGSAEIGVFVYDIAVTKCLQVLTVANENNFPLQSKVEKV